MLVIAGQAALVLRPCLEAEVGSGAARRLFSAAFAVVEVRSRTKSAIGFCGFLEDFHLPSSSSNQNFFSRPWAMARLRSSAHLGITRSGQRCIAKCAQSYLP